MIVPSNLQKSLDTCAIPLAFYAQHLGMGECAFWGVNSDDDTGTCKSIWTLDNRRMVANYLCQAQGEIENILGYPLEPKWFTDELHTLCRRTNKMETTWKHFISGGVRATSTIAAAAVVDDSADPYTIGPIATTVTDISEVHLYHVGSDQEVTPSYVDITGGFLTAEIPQCRMVLPEYYNNPTAGWAITDAVFADELDVVRVYNDPSTQAEFVKANCSGTCGACRCTEETSPGCIKGSDYPLGIVTVSPATYAGGTWSVSGALCGCYSGVRLNYRAGLQTLTPDLIDAIIRLAHSRMPHTPCGCDPVKAFWENDYAIPQFMTPERERCLFGTREGAWAAWRIINNPGLRVMRSGIL